MNFCVGRPDFGSDFTVIEGIPDELTSSGILEDVTLGFRAEAPRLRGIRTFRTLWKNVHATSAEFFGSEFRSTVFLNCDFSGADFSGTFFNGCLFRNCRLLGCQFRNTKMTDSAIEGCNCDFLIFQNTDSVRCSFSDSSFREAEIHSCTLKKCRFEKCLFKKTSFFETFLRDLDFSTCELTAPTLSDDLREIRGATVGSETALELIRMLGIIVEN